MLKRTAFLLLSLLLLLLAGCAGTTPQAQNSPSPTATRPPTPLSVYVVATNHTLSALTASDGSVRWSFQSKGLITYTPAVSNDLVYLSADGVYALSASDGSVRWHVQTPAKAASSPVVLENVLYINSDDGQLYALNASDGSVRWRSQKDGNVVAVSDGVVYAQSDEVSALSASDGSVLWSYRSAGDDTALWTISGNQVCAVEEYRSEGDVANNRLHVLNRSDGKEQWSFAAGKTVLSLVGIENDLIYLYSGTNTTALPYDVYALNASDGSVRWHVRLKDGYSALPFLANGIIFVAAYNGYVSALSATDGKMLWRSQIPLSDPTITVPGVVAASDGAVYVFFLNQGFSALNTSDGSVKWSMPTQDAIQTTGLVNAAIYGYTADRNTAHAINNYVFALNAGDGSIRWRYETGTNVPAITIG